MHLIMNKIYYIALRFVEKLKKSLPKGNDLVFRDIKQDPLTTAELEMYQLSGSYEALSKRCPVV
jgi:arsenate reductase